MVSNYYFVNHTINIMAGEYDFTLDQGSETDVTLTFYTDSAKTTLKDLTNVTWQMQIRVNKDDESYIDELTNANSRIDITNAATGVIILEFPRATTLLYSFDTSYYTLLSTTSGVVVRELQGKITLDKEVTK